MVEQVGDLPGGDPGRADRSCWGFLPERCVRAGDEGSPGRWSLHWPGPSPSSRRSGTGRAGSDGRPRKARSTSVAYAAAWTARSRANRTCPASTRSGRVSVTTRDERGRQHRQQRSPVPVGLEGHQRPAIDRHRHRGDPAGGHHAASLPDCAVAGRPGLIPVARSEYAIRPRSVTYGVTISPSNSTASNGGPGRRDGHPVGEDLHHDLTGAAFQLGVHVYDPALEHLPAGHLVHRRGAPLGLLVVVLRLGDRVRASGGTRAGTRPPCSPANREPFLRAMPFTPSREHLSCHPRTTG